MRIGLTIRTFNPASGGLQAHAQMLSHGLLGRGHEVRVATRAVQQSQKWADYYRISEPPSSTVIDGVSITVLSGCHAANRLLWLASKCVVRRRLHALTEYIAQTVFTDSLCRTFKGVDLIHHVGQAHELIGFAAAAAAKRLKVPLVIQPTLHPGQWGDSALDVRLFAKADRLLAHTEYERAALRRMGLEAACDIVGNGVDDRSSGSAERFRSRYQLDGPIILFLGRKSTDKGYPLLIEAFASVREAHPHVHLVALGPPGEASLPTPRGFHDLGFASHGEKHDALAACDVLCVPSEGESFGLVYMEAARYEKPSVARNLPVLRELFGNQDAIVLAGSGDSGLNQVPLTVEELYACIARLLDDPSDAQKVGANAKKVSDRFLWPQVIRNFEAAYKAAIDQKTNACEKE